MHERGKPPNQLLLATWIFMTRHVPYAEDHLNVGVRRRFSLYIQAAPKPRDSYDRHLTEHGRSF